MYVCMRTIATLILSGNDLGVEGAGMYVCMYVNPQCRLLHWFDALYTHTYTYTCIHAGHIALILDKIYIHIHTHTYIYMHTYRPHGSDSRKNSTYTYTYIHTYMQATLL